MNVNALYQEVRQMHKELHMLRTSLIPEADLSAAERKELNKIFAEMESGKERNWRRISKK